MARGPGEGDEGGKDDVYQNPGPVLVEIPGFCFTRCLMCVSLFLFLVFVYTLLFYKNQQNFAEAQLFLILK